MPPLLLMAVIFFFSAQEGLDSGLGAADTVGRKLIHIAEYGLLALLWWRALRTRVSARSAVVAAFLIASAYAATDEYHQSFVATRNGSVLDWALDTAGAALAMLRVHATRRSSA